MEYKFYEIGERVRNLRKNQGQSQSEFIGMLKDKYNVSISRNRLSSIENGNQKDFSLEFLLAVCQEYDCNMGFLFGEYQEKTYNNHFICNSTGLTEETIHKLEFEKDNCRIEQFNKFILEPNFWEILNYFETHKNTSKELIEKKITQTKVFWEQSVFATDDSTKKMFERASKALEEECLDYSLSKDKCLFMIREIVNKFLPEDKC